MLPRLKRKTTKKENKRNKKAPERNKSLSKEKKGDKIVVSNTNLPENGKQNLIGYRKIYYKMRKNVSL